MATCCPICYKVEGGGNHRVRVTEDSNGEEAQQRFFQLFQRYLGDGEVSGRTTRVDENGVGVESQFFFPLEDFVGIGMICWGDCSKIVESFCELYNQLKIIELRLNWQVLKVKEVLKASGKVRSRMECFREFVRKLELGEGRWKNPEKLIESIVKSRKSLISKCSRKLKSSYPTLSIPDCNGAKLSPVPNDKHPMYRELEDQSISALRASTNDMTEGSPVQLLNSLAITCDTARGNGKSLSNESYLPTPSTATRNIIPINQEYELVSSDSPMERETGDQSGTRCDFNKKVSASSADSTSAVPKQVTLETATSANNINDIDNDNTKNPCKTSTAVEKQIREGPEDGQLPIEDRNQDQASKRNDVGDSDSFPPSAPLNNPAPVSRSLLKPQLRSVKIVLERIVEFPLVSHDVTQTNRQLDHSPPKEKRSRLRSPNESAGEKRIRTYSDDDQLCTHDSDPEPTGHDVIVIDSVVALNPSINPQAPISDSLLNSQLTPFKVTLERGVEVAHTSPDVIQIIQLDNQPPPPKLPIDVVTSNHAPVIEIMPQLPSTHGCPHCGRTFSSNEQLQLHQQEIHIVDNDQSDPAEHDEGNEESTGRKSDSEQCQSEHSGESSPSSEELDFHQEKAHSEGVKVEQDVISDKCWLSQSSYEYEGSVVDSCYEDEREGNSPKCGTAEAFDSVCLSDNYDHIEHLAPANDNDDDGSDTDQGSGDKNATITAHRQPKKLILHISKVKNSYPKPRNSDCSGASDNLSEVPNDTLPIHGEVEVEDEPINDVRASTLNIVEGILLSLLNSAHVAEAAAITDSATSSKPTSNEPNRTSITVVKVISTHLDDGQVSTHGSDPESTEDDVSDIDSVASLNAPMNKEATISGSLLNLQLTPVNATLGRDDVEFFHTSHDVIQIQVENPPPPKLPVDVVTSDHEPRIERISLLRSTHPCQHCGKTFSSNARLKLHQQEVHIGEDDQGDRAEHVGDDVEQLNLHMREAHNEEADVEEEVISDDCFLSSSEFENEDSDIDLSSEEEFEGSSPTCGPFKPLASKNSDGQHEYFRLKCPDCSTLFGRIESLLTHRMTTNPCKASYDPTISVKVDVLVPPRDGDGSTHQEKFTILLATIDLPQALFLCKEKDCGLALYSMEDMDKHKELHGTFPCKFCKLQFTYAPTLAKHELQHSKQNWKGKGKKRVYYCSRCDFKCERRFILYAHHHLKTHLSLTLNQPVCAICKTNALHLHFKGPKVAEHFKIFHDVGSISSPQGKLECTVNNCTAYFLNQMQLIYHLKLHHNIANQKEYKCKDNDCGKRFTRMGHLQKHILAGHLRKEEAIACKPIYNAPTRTKIAVEKGTLNIVEGILLSLLNSAHAAEAAAITATSCKSITNESNQISIAVEKGVSTGLEDDQLSTHESDPEPTTVDVTAIDSVASLNIPMNKAAPKSRSLLNPLLRLVKGTVEIPHSSRDVSQNQLENPPPTRLSIDAVTSNRASHTGRMSRLRSTHPCQHCSRTFSSKERLQLHQQEVHIGDDDQGDHAEHVGDDVERLKFHIEEANSEGGDVEKDLVSDSCSSSSSDDEYLYQDSDIESNYEEDLETKPLCLSDTSDHDHQPVVPNK